MKRTITTILIGVLSMSACTPAEQRAFLKAIDSHHVAPVKPARAPVLDCGTGTPMTMDDGQLVCGQWFDGPGD